MSGRKLSRAPAPLTADTVLRLVRAAGSKGLTVRDLVDRTAGKGRTGRSERRRQLRAALRELDEQGRIVSGRAKRVLAAEHTELISGRVRLRPNGAATVIPPTPGAQPILVSAKGLRGAGNGDLVVVRLLNRGRTSRQRSERLGQVVRVLERSEARVVGRWSSRLGHSLIEPMGSRPGSPIVPVAVECESQPEPGDLVVVSLEAGRRQPHGTVLERLGPVDRPGVVERAVINMLGIPDCFDPSCLEEAEALPDPTRGEDLPALTGQHLPERWDLRDNPVVTIDPTTARDFDDAVDARAGRDGEIIVQVHIADVSYHISEGSALDREARRRGTSVYLPGLCIPMLPERISSDLCCLREGVDRLAMTVRFTVRPDGSVIAVRMNGSIIRSKRRCTYHEVAGWLELPAEEWPEEVAPLSESLHLLHEASRRLRRARQQRGSLDLELKEPELVLDDDGQLQEIRLAERTEAHRLIEDLMVTANECVARYLIKAGQPALHRAHEPPSADRLESLSELLAELGYRLEPTRAGDDLAHGALQAILEQSRGRSDQRLVATLVLRSLSRAHYSHESPGHHALAADAYLHFTSPIRRYPDLVCHRQLRGLLQERATLNEEELKVKLSELAQLGAACSMTEQRAEAAEREARRWLTVLHLRDQVGQAFDGFVTGVTEHGIFVEISPFQIDGMIHLSDLRDDYYILDPHGHQLVGERTRNRYRLGDAVRVKLLRVDTGSMQLQLAPAHEPTRATRRGARSGRPSQSKERGQIKKRSQSKRRNPKTRREHR